MNPNNINPEQEFIIDPELVMRESTGPAAA